MANIVSYSLWGKQDHYYDGAFKNIELVQKFYPNFVTRFYCSPSLPDKYRSKYEDAGAEVVVVEGGKDNWTGLFWRFYACEDGDIVLIRDTDSRIRQREVDAVEHWLKTRFDFHAMRDHMEHTTVPILGGMWGVRNGLLRGIKNQIRLWTPRDAKGNDQDFLAKKIWPQVKKKAIVHCQFAQITKFKPEYTYNPMRFFGHHKLVPFPTPLTDGHFVGERVDD